MALFCGYVAYPSEAAEGVAYRAEITGVADEALLGLLREVSQLLREAERPPATDLALRRRIAADQERLTEALRSEGYYASSIRVETEKEGGVEIVRLRVDPGRRFVVDLFDVQLSSGVVAPGLRERVLETAGRRIGAPARAADILEAERGILLALLRNGHPFARRAERKVVVDHARNTASITLAIAAGNAAPFGGPNISGLESVKPRYVRRQLPWSQGEAFDQRKLDQGRRALARSNLFDSVRVTPGTEADAGGEVPINIELKEREHRSIGFGLGYSTDLGFGGKVFWEHRNLLGEGESLNLEARATEQLYGAAARYRERGFLSRRNTLLLNLEATEERFEAYRSRNVATGGAIERDLAEGLKASVGLTIEGLRVRQSGETEQLVLVSVPTSIRQDTTDNLLNPTRGHRLRAEYTPFFQPDNTDLNFHRMVYSGSVYQGIFPENRVVLAARALVGFIFGPRTDDIPANRRLYAGGGGSVRGYEFQSLGPLDNNGDPVGGRSVVEAGIEARIRLFGDFGLVPFLDVGNAYDKSFPEPDRNLRAAYGIGLRYFTPIGPIRADIAFPINRRREVDDAFQFYISLGQAF